MVGAQTDVDVALAVHALGPVRVTRDRVELRLGGPRQRRLLAVLLIHRGAVVSVDRVAEAVFQGEPTDAAATTLRSYVARLRRVLGDDMVVTRPPGYQLALPARAFDVAVVETWVEEARAMLQRQDPTAAAELVRQALDAWQGEAYAEFADEPWAYPEAQRLAELRLVAQELLVDAELACGHTAQMLPTLESLCREHPLREGFRGQLMTGYYRTGRQAEALAAFRAFRAELADELGIDPSPALVELERRILAQDPLLDVAGEPLRGYRLGERLGTGRDGTVHAASLAGVDRPLVIKTLRPALADDPDFVRAFEATAHRVASLRHPAVVPLDDYWREPGAAHVVMPRLSGGTLRDRLARGPLTARELLVLVERIGGALARAAAADLVHGRVTPENVLYDGAGDPVLGDFWLGGPVAPQPQDDVHDLVRLVRAATRASGPSGRRLAAVLADPPEGIERLVTDLLAALGVDATPQQSKNPYQGLRAFDEADEHFYFGRTGLVDELVERFARGSRLALLVGASGTGKSSAVRAGLLPRLRQAEGSRDWFVATMLPGGAPYAELADALRRVAVAPVPAIGRGPHGIDAAVRDVVPGDLLLVLDQLEELFTLSADEEQRDFLAALTLALTVPDSRLRVVATIRADYYDRPLAIQPFGSLVSEATVAIPAMLPGEIEAAVVEPALRVGRTVDRALAAELVGAVATEPSALPALQFVLYQLAERGALTYRSYRELGGLDGAIAARAEELYQSLDDADRAHVRELFERLVVVGEGEPTRRRATREEVGPADALVDSWAAARLLTLDVHPQTRAPTVEVAHEALVREWPRLREWIEADRSELVVLARLRESARAWDELDRDRAALLRGTALEAAVEVTSRRAALPPIEKEFVEESRLAAEEEQVHQVMLIRRQAQTNRRLRWQLGGIAILLVLALVGGFVALDQRGEARAQQRTAVARELAAAAEASLRDDPERAILLGLAAIDATRRHGGPVLPEARDALHKAVSSSRLLRSFPDQGGALDWSADGHFATEGPEHSGMLEILDAETGDSIRSWKVEDDDLNEVDFSPDGRRIATVGDDGALRVWDRATGREVSDTGGPPGPVFDVNFSPDSRLVAASWLNTLHFRLIDAETGKVVWSRPMGPGNSDFSPDGRHVVVAEPHTGQALILDVRTGREVRVLDGLPDPSEVAWHPGGRWIAVASESRVVVFDAATGEPRFETSGHSGKVNAVAWSRDGALATGSDDGTARVYTLVQASLLEQLVLSAQELRDGVSSVQFSPSGDELMVAPWTITSTKVFDVRPTGGGEVGNVPIRSASLPSAWLAPDGRSVWVLAADGAIGRHDVATGRRLQSIRPGPDAGEDQLILLSPDGGLLAAVAHDFASFTVYDTATGRRAFRVSRVEGLSDLSWSSDGDYLAVVDDPDPGPGTVWVLDRRGKRVRTLEDAQGNRTSSVAFVGDGRLLARTSLPYRDHPDGRTIEIWDWRKERRLHTIPANTDRLAGAPAGNLLVSSRLVEATADVFDARTGRRVATLEGHAGLVAGIAFDRTGKRVATGSDDGSARVWDARTGELLTALHVPGVGATDATFSVDGRRLLTSWDDKLARVWTLDLDELVEIARVRLTRGLTTAECQRYLHLSTCPG